MTTEQVIQEIRNILGKHKGSERELYEALIDEASGWEMRLEELEDEEEEDDGDWDEVLS